MEARERCTGGPASSNTAAEKESVEVRRISARAGSDASACKWECKRFRDTFHHQEFIRA